MPPTTATRYLPAINTMDVHIASSSRSRDSTPYTATESYAAASDAYYERASTDYAGMYASDSEAHASDSGHRRTHSTHSDRVHRRLASQHERRMQTLDEQEGSPYDGLAYDAPHASEEETHYEVNDTAPVALERPVLDAPPLVYDPDYVIAMHDFMPDDNQGSCLTFRAGEVIHVLNRDPTGWWDGELEGRRGWFPSNYISSDAAAFAAAAELAGLETVTVPSSADPEDQSPEPVFDLPPPQPLTQEEPAPPVDEVEFQEAVQEPSRRHRSPGRRYRSRRSREASGAIDSSDASESVVDRHGSCPPMMTPMVHALVLLQNAVRANRVGHFQPSTACIISCVRSVLATCECLNKESTILTTHPRLFQQRKKVLAELARLVGQARQASENAMAARAAAERDGSPVVLTPDRIRELQQMVHLGDLVYNHVRRFLQIAVDCGVELPPDRTFDGAPGLEEAEALSSPIPHSSSEDEEPVASGSRDPMAFRSRVLDAEPFPSSHLRESSSRSDLSPRPSETTAKGKEVDPSERPSQASTAVATNMPSTSPPSSPSDRSSDDYGGHWASRVREETGATYRPRSPSDPHRSVEGYEHQLSTMTSAAAYARQITRRRSFSKRGIDSDHSHHRSPVRDASAPYRKPKYSISSVSSFSSYDSSQPDSQVSSSDSTGTYFPHGPCSASQALTTLRLTHDRLLSVIAAFIGHIHSHSRSSHASSKGHLIEMTRKTVDQVRYLLTLVDAVEENMDICELKPREMAILKNARVALYTATNDIVEAVKDMMSPLEAGGISEEDEKTRALQAATSTLRAGGECVKAVNMCLSTRAGETPFMINIAAVPAADTPPSTSPPSAASSRASSSPPRTPKSGFRRTHSYSMSQPQVQGPRVKTHAPSASVGSGIVRRRAQSDLSPMPMPSRLAEVGEGVTEEQEDEPSRGEETVRIQSESLVVPEEEEARDEDTTPMPEEPTPTPATDSGSAANIPMLVISETHPLPPLPPSLPTSRASDHTNLAPALPEDHYLPASVDPSPRHSDELQESERESFGQAVVSDTPDSVGQAASTPEATSSELREATSLSSALEDKLLRGELPATPSAPPEFADAMYDPRDLLVNDTHQLVAASLDVMVIKIAPLSSTPDRAFIVAFLLTFRLFTTPTKFVEALIGRWNVQPSPSWPNEERQSFDIKLPFMRVRIMRCIKNWIDHYWVYETDDEVLPYLQKLVDAPLPPGTDASLGTIVNVVRTLVYGEIMRVHRGGTRAMDRLNRDATISASGPSNADMPAPIVKRTVHSRLGAAEMDTAITELDPIEVARQLTLMEARLYSKIPAQELVELGKAGARAVHVKAISSFSTATTGWVSESILNEQDQKKRTTLLKYFIKLAHQCTELHNYSTMRSILAALDSSTISRLTKTWSSLSSKYKILLDAMRRLADHAKNYGAYREALRETKPPAVPFLGLYLTDLTFCREGNPNSRPSPLDPSRPLINFIKYYRLSRIIQDVQRFQNAPYNLQPVPEIQRYLSLVIENGKSTGDLHDLYRRSLVLEPRQANDAAPPDSKSGLLGWASRN